MHNGAIVWRLRIGGARCRWLIAHLRTYFRRAASSRRRERARAIGIASSCPCPFVVRSSGHRGEAEGGVSVYVRIVRNIAVKNLEQSQGSGTRATRTIKIIEIRDPNTQDC